MKSSFSEIAILKYEEFSLENIIFF